MSAHHRKKQRPIRSCLSCRTRRIKCDQAHPACTNCAKTSRSCLYNYSWDVGTQGNSSRDELATTSPGEDDPFISGHGSMVGELGHLHQSLGGRSRYFGPSFWAISDKDGPEFPTFLEDQAGDGPDTSCICQDSYGLQNFESGELSSMRLLRREVLNFDSMHSLGQIIERLPPRKTCDQLWVIFMGTVYPLVPILHLPTFYRQYDEFWRSVQEFTRDGSPGGFLAECPSFLALLLSILFCGSLQSYLTRSPTENHNGGPSAGEVRMTRRLYRLTMQTLTMLAFPRDPTLYSLAAFFIWHVPLIREESERSTIFVSIAFRVGQALGLHRDPKHFNISGPEAETRRKLWWHILHKDALSSAASGLPQMMWNRKQHDTEMISENKDLDLGQERSRAFLSPTPSPELARVSSSLPSYTTTPLGCVDFRKLEEPNADCRQVVSVGRILITNTLREILGRQTDLMPWSVQDVQHFQNLIERLAIQVKGRVDKLQASDTPENPGDYVLPAPESDEAMADFRRASMECWKMAKTNHNVEFLSWGRRLLMLMLEKVYCTLYQPLPTNPDKLLWREFREIAISHFHAYIEKYLLMCTEPLYAPFHWMYPGNYQPIQAVAFLLTDLINNPKSNEAPTSRHLVDRVFSVLDRQEGVVAERSGHLLQRRLSFSGKGAWAMLWRLRRRAWLGMGIDPSVLWTCARKHGHASPPSESEDSDINDGDVSEAEGDAGNSNSELLPTLSNPIYDPLEQYTGDSYLMDMDAGQRLATDNTFDWNF